METAEDFREFARINKRRADYKRELDRLYPRGWNIENLADYLCQKHKGMTLSQLEAQERGEEPPPAPPDFGSEPLPMETEAKFKIPEVDSASVQARFDKYLQHYEADKPNDRHLLLQLCRYELALEKFTEQYTTILSNPDANPREVTALTNAISKLNKEYLDTQKALGIGKTDRMEQQDAGVKLIDYIRQAKKMLVRQSFPISCPYCCKGEDRIMEQYGILIWHLMFDEDVAWSFQFTCPRCKTVVVVNQDNVQDVKMMFGWVEPTAVKQ